MSQNDFNIANQGFPATRADINSALQALVSNSAGDTEPATTYAYQLWYDSTADMLKMRNADNDAWIVLATIDQTTDATTDLVRATGVSASAIIPAGTTDERDGTPSAGMMRFNSTEGYFEGYDGTEWGQIGGDVSTLIAANISDGTDTVETSYVVNGSAKAWVNFNGTGTIAVRDSLNISGLVDNGGGDYNTNFVSSMSDDDYSVSGLPMRDSANLAILCVFGSTTYGNTITSGGVRLNVRDNVNSSVDGLAVFASIHGDLA